MEQKRVGGQCGRQLYFPPAMIPLDDVGNEAYSIQSDLMVPALSVNCDLISRDDAGDEVHSISGTAHVPIGQAFTEKINLHD